MPVPGLGLLTYRVPEGTARPPSGARVRVPLGKRAVTGCVVGVPAPVPDGTAVRDLVEILDDGPFLPPSVVDLALWVGEYYLSGPGSAIQVALPPGARGARPHAFRRVTAVELIPDPPEVAVRGRRQREALARLERRTGLVPLSRIAGGGVTLATVRSLERLGLVRVGEVVRDRDPLAANAAGWTLAAGSVAPPTLTDEQALALERLEAQVRAGGFRVTLLDGVTGSGKTEVYLRLARAVLDAGRRVLILVPEIALTPALAGIFHARFEGRVAIQHSGLSAGERHDQWHRIRRGAVDVVVGTRSAVFAPLEALGLIVVDEEHDGSYKQDETPRYHGRDVAVMRGRLEGALVVLGSATPSLESAANAEAGRYERQRLTKRVLDRPLAEVRIVDMRAEYAARGPDVTLSEALGSALETRLARGEQSLVLLNRRGFATVIFCRECGGSLECPRCSVALTYHRSGRRVRCHYCGYAASVPERCGLCRGEYLEQAGFGTERLQADLAARLPGARIVRVDRDTVRRRGAVTRVIADVAAGRVDVVVGTQMIAKGHDFPAVTLVGVVLADVGLGLADFRASERTFQLLTQVVGRAGRGTTPGEAIVQTLYPRHYSIEAAAAQDYPRFFEREMAFRRDLEYPPVLALVNVVVKGRTLEGAIADARDLTGRVRAHGPGGRVLGPAPAALSRLRDEYRAQFFIKGRQRATMRAALTAALAERTDLRRRTIVDVDPVSVL